MGDARTRNIAAPMQVQPDLARGRCGAGDPFPWYARDINRRNGDTWWDGHLPCLIFPALALNGKGTIVAAIQKGSGFSAPVTVSASSGNEWNPTIAADSNGKVTVAFESYRNSNYDLYARSAVNGTWQKEFLVAGSGAYEAYPSAAYDLQGRLWIAYEEGAERWGKD